MLWSSQGPFLYVLFDSQNRTIWAGIFLEDHTDSKSKVVSGRGETQVFWFQVPCLSYCALLTMSSMVASNYICV